MTMTGEKYRNEKSFVRNCFPSGATVATWEEKAKIDTYLWSKLWKYLLANYSLNQFPLPFMTFFLREKKGLIFVFLTFFFFIELIHVLSFHILLSTICLLLVHYHATLHKNIIICERLKQKKSLSCHHTYYNDDV